MSALPRRRGRPPRVRDERDYGTPELRLKRMLGETSEALDLCMERELITPQQHWCGIHWRWLYTLRYGVPTVLAVDPGAVQGRTMAPDDPSWREAREIEYAEALKKLSMGGYAKLLNDVCIHNVRPDFLYARTRISPYALDELVRFRAALDLLVGHWKRK